MVQAAQKKFKVGDMVKRINTRNWSNGNTIRVGDIGKVVGVHGIWIDVEVNGKVIPDNDYYNLQLIPNPGEKIVITHDGKTTIATLYKNNRPVESAEANCSPEDKFDFNVGAKLALERLDRKVKYGEYTIVKIKYPHGRQSYNFKTKDKTAKVGMNIMVISSFTTKPCEVKIVEVIPGADYTGDYRIENMREIEIKEVPKYYNGKIVCIAKGYNNNPYLINLPFTVGKIYDVTNGKIIDDHGDHYDHYDCLERICFAMGNTFIPIVE